MCDVQAGRCVCVALREEPHKLRKPCCVKFLQDTKCAEAVLQGAPSGSWGGAIPLVIHG